MKPFAARTRRQFLAGGSATVLAAAAGGLAMPAVSRAASRPQFTHGVQSGDVDGNSGMVWTRTDRPARVRFEVSTTESFADPMAFPSLDALPDTDFAVKRLLNGLTPDQDVFHRLTAVDLDDVVATSRPLVGRFRTAPSARRRIRFAWSGDTAGQG